jgi:hypothetical protein
VALLQWHQIGKPNYFLRESMAIPFSKPDFLSSKPYLVLVGTQNKSELGVERMPKLELPFERPNEARSKSSPLLG